MNSRNPMKTIRWVAIGSLMSTVLAGCSTPYHAAPISSVDESSSAPVMTAGNDNNSTSVSTPMPVRPQLSSANNTQPVSRSVQQPRSANVQTSSDGRIQYNRNYDAIPKAVTAEIPIRFSAVIHYFTSLISPDLTSANWHHRTIFLSRIA